MIKSGNIHDSTFRAALTCPKVCIALIEYYLPAKIKQWLDYDSIEFVPTSFVDEALSQTFCDVVFKIKIAGSKSFLVFLIEHQSNPQRLMPLRTYNYAVKIMAQFAKSSKYKAKPLPLIWPIVFYHQTKAYPFSDDIRDLMNVPKELIELSTSWGPGFQLIDASKLPDSALLSQPYIGPLLYVFKHIKDEKFSPCLKPMLESLYTQEGARGSTLEKILLEYIQRKANISIESFMHILKQAHVSAEAKESTMTVFEQAKIMGKKEGYKKGIEQGIEQGIMKGMQKQQVQHVIRMLELGIDPSMIQQVTGISTESLQKLVVNVH